MSNRKGSLSSPKEVASAFVEAVLREDSSRMGALMGMDLSKGSPMDQTFGKALGPSVEKYWADQAKNPADYRWTIYEEQVTKDVAKLRVDLFSPDTGAIADKMGELLGETIGPDGTLQMPETPPMSSEEAERRAREDPAIRPLHYRMPLHLVKHEGQWVIDPQSEGNGVLISVIRRGGTLTDNEAYRVK